MFGVGMRPTPRVRDSACPRGASQFSPRILPGGHVASSSLSSASSSSSSTSTSGARDPRSSLFSSLCPLTPLRFARARHAPLSDLLCDHLWGEGPVRLHAPLLCGFLLSFCSWCSSFIELMRMASCYRVHTIYRVCPYMLHCLWQLVPPRPLCKCDRCIGVCIGYGSGMHLVFTLSVVSGKGFWRTPLLLHLLLL